MKRDSKTVSTVEEIYDILTRCDTVRIGITDGEYPYVVPMTFGCELKDGQIILYFHSAKEGHKVELLAKNPHVCVEADLYYQVARDADGGITARYESVIGTGIAEKLTEKAQIVEAMKLMLRQYKESGFPVTSCTGLPRVDAYRVVLTQVSGKHSPGQEQ